MPRTNPKLAQQKLLEETIGAANGEDYILFVDETAIDGWEVPKQASGKQHNPAPKTPSKMIPDNPCPKALRS